MIIREMTEQDIFEVLKIEEESFSDPWTENMFSSLTSSKIYKSFVAEENGQILGYVSVIATFYVFEIMNLAVKKDYRNLGIGKSLMEKALLTANEYKADKALLEVRKSNFKAQSLYVKLGFKIDGCRQGYYPDGEDALLMSLDL